MLDSQSKQRRRIRSSLRLRLWKCISGILGNVFGFIGKCISGIVGLLGNIFGFIGKCISGIVGFIVECFGVSRSLVLVSLGVFWEPVGKCFTNTYGWFMVYLGFLMRSRIVDRDAVCNERQRVKDLLMLGFVSDAIHRYCDYKKIPLWFYHRFLLWSGLFGFNASEMEFLCFVLELELKRSTPPAHHKLKINSYNALVTSTRREDFVESGCICMECISTEFCASGYKWALIIYPKGNHKDHQIENFYECGTELSHISMYIRLLSKLDKDESVMALFKIFIYDHITHRYLTVQDIRERRFNRAKDTWGIPKVIALDTFKDFANGYLSPRDPSNVGNSDDSCIFGAEVFVINTSSGCAEMSVMRNTTKHFSITSCFQWKIRNSITLGDTTESPVFICCKHSWQLVLERDRKTGDGTSSFSVSIRSVGSAHKTLFMCLVINLTDEAKHKHDQDKRHTDYRRLWFGHQPVRLTTFTMIEQSPDEDLRIEVQVKSVMELNANVENIELNANAEKIGPNSAKVMELNANVEKIELNARDLNNPPNSAKSVLEVFFS